MLHWIKTLNHWRFLLVGSTLAGVLSAPVGAYAGLSAEDKKALAETAIQWAIDGGLPDFKFVKEPEKLVVLNTYLPQGAKLELPGRKLAVTSLVRIQATADVGTDVTYFRFGPFSGGDARASGSIALVPVQSIRNPAGGGGSSGADLEFEKRDAKWVVSRVADRWTH